MNNYIFKNVLVTGGAGFIGSHFIRYVLAHYPHARLINLDKLTYAGSMTNLENLSDPSRHHFIHGDIEDWPLVNELLITWEIDTVVHFAAETHVDRSINDPASFVRTNINGTFVLLEACREQWLVNQQKKTMECRFHHVSTDEVYGSLTLDEKLFTEHAPYQPNSPYAASKAASDHLVRAYGQTYGLPATISHCSNNYGPYQHREKLIPTIITACLNNQLIPIYGNGGNIRDWLFVEDHCQGICKILQKGKPGEVYNVGGNNEWRNLDLIREICRLMDERFPQPQPHEELISFVQDRPGHDERYGINSEKIGKGLGWHAKTPLIAGLIKTIDFFASRK